MPKKKFQTIQSLRGMHDILPQDQVYWERVRRVFKELAEDYGFARIDTPLVEEAALFVRGTGETSEVVEKQMYIFKTKGGDNVSLRPEGTPGVARAYIEHGMVELPHPVKLYYFGPMFRYESPQAGRYRQFYHAGVEMIGGQEPVLDAQIIQFFLHFLNNLGLKKLEVHINSLGCPDCRPAFRRALSGYYRSKKSHLCSDCQQRLKANPLRLLDCKDEKCQPIKAGAPLMLDYLCTQCRHHFKAVLEFLEELEIPYFLNNHLVRGLDYYTKTVFEIFREQDKEEFESEALGSALGGGGRYDELIKVLGGKPTPAVGAALGVERVIDLMKEQGVKIGPRSSPKVFLVQLGELGQRKILKLFGELHQAQIPVAESVSKSSIKAQLKIADRLGVKFAVILGQQEALEGTVILRDMQSGVQEIIPRSKVVNELKKRLAKK